MVKEIIYVFSNTKSYAIITLKCEGLKKNLLKSITDRSRLPLAHHAGTRFFSKFSFFPYFNLTISALLSSNGISLPLWFLLLYNYYRRPMHAPALTLILFIFNSKCLSKHMFFFKYFFN